MRLTLRTLLACLDGVLESADREDLGRRIAASQTATALTQRIEELLGRSGLRAPLPRGRGLAEDANSVAEYLDNVLPAENLENFERICLESDMHLAETAACHRLLAEFTRQPHESREPAVAVRQRLLGGLASRLAVPSPEAEQEAAHEELLASVRMLVDARDTETVGGPGGGAARTAAGRAPGVTPRLVAALAILLLAVVAGALVWSLDLGRPGKGPARVVAAAPRSLPDPSAEPPAVTPPEPGKTSEPQDAPAPDVALEPRATVAAPPQQSTAPATAAPPEDGVPNEPAAADPSARREGGAMAAVGPPPGATLVPEPPIPRDMAPAPEPAPEADSPFATVKPVAPSGPPAAESVAVEVGDPAGLLRRDPGPPATPWTTCRKGAQEPPGLDWAAMPDCFPELLFKDLTLRLHPCARARITVAADGTPRIQLLSGRAVVVVGRPETAFAISAGGLEGVVRGGPAATVGLDVAFDRDADPRPGIATLGRARLIPPPEGIEWRSIAGGATTAPRPAGEWAADRIPGTVALVWSPAEPAAVQRVGLDRRPDWIGSRSANVRLEREAARFVVARLPPGTDAAGVLATLLSDTREEHRMAAATTLALIGDPAAVVDLVVEDSPRRRLKDGQWTRFESLAIPTALAADGESENRLRQAFLARAGETVGPTLWRLACGLGDDQLAAGGDAFLVESLESPHLAVRRYAIRDLVAIVRPTDFEASRYHADRGPDGNREALKWWRSQLAAGRIRRSLRGVREAPGNADRGPEAGADR